MLQKIRLTSFRNFKDKLISFSPETTVIVGPNASGKTNILESLFLLSTGKSFRARIEEEMINYEDDIARVAARVGNTEQVESSMSKNKNHTTKLEVVLTRGLIDIGTNKPERVARKKLLLNGISKRLVDFAGTFKTVLFGPQHLGLVTESPSIRRDFLDTLLSQVDREYRRAILSYEKGLRQRNKLLFRIREEGLSRSQLMFWNQLLIKNGDYISKKREEFIDFTNNIQDPRFNAQYKLDYDKSAISEVRLEQYKDEEVAVATTLVGPHRDDMQFQILNSELQKKRNLATYGSRGETRMGVLWLKLSELAFIEEKTRSASSGQAGGKPTLLLDDIFSELDHEHRKIVMRVAMNQQTIITTADPHFLENFRKVDTIKLDGA